MSAQSLPEIIGSGKNPAASAELSAIVCQIRELTHASGVAIALTSNRPGQLECHARSGPTAPEIGASLVVEDSLTGLCIRSGKQIQCDNAEADLRVRRTAMFQLGVRSVVITPVLRGNCVRGVLAVFANVSHGFSNNHLARLNAFAEQIAEALCRNQLAEQKRVDNLRLPPSSKVVAEEEADSNFGGAELPFPAPAGLFDRFATLESVVRQQRKRPSNVVVLIAAGFLLLIGATIWALAFRQPISHPAAKIVLQERASASVPEVTSTAVKMSSQGPANQAALRIEPSAPAQHQGVSFALNVVFSHGRDVSAVPMQISYDPKVLRFVNLSAGGFFSKNGQKVILLHRNDPTSGIIKINAQLPPGASPISGDGTLCQLVFVGLEKGSGAISVEAKARNSHDKLMDVVGSRVAVTVN